jgi:hypothetical protein
MVLDTPRGGYKYFEDFLVTAIGDLPEVDTLAVAATGVTAIVANARGGVVGVGFDTSNDDDVAAVSTNLNWVVGSNTLIGEVRVRSTVITDQKVFIGFGDSLASADETTFSATTDTITLDTMTDAIGFLYDEDSTTKQFWAVSGTADAVTVGQGLGTRHNFVASTFKTFRVAISDGGKYVEWSVDGSVVHSVKSATALISTTAPLALGVWGYEQGTATVYGVDYLYAEGGRG